MLKTIVVAWDGAEASEKIIQALKTLRIQSTTKIIFCHVLTPLGNETDITVDKPHKSRESAYQELETELDYYQKQIPSKIQIEILIGDVAEEIIRLTNIEQAELIVIGTRGLKGVTSIIAGSVSSQVVSDAPCSVLIVKSDQINN